MSQVTVLETVSVRRLRDVNAAGFKAVGISGAPDRPCNRIWRYQIGTPEYGQCKIQLAQLRLQEQANMQAGLATAGYYSPQQSPPPRPAVKRIPTFNGFTATKRPSIAAAGRRPEAPEKPPSRLPIPR
jgi:hypothetical protein